MLGRAAFSLLPHILLRLSPNPPKGCGHADVVRDESGMNEWCGFDPYGFDRVWALEAHQWEVDDPGWR